MNNKQLLANTVLLCMYIIGTALVLRGLIETVLPWLN